MAILCFCPRETLKQHFLYQNSFSIQSIRDIFFDRAVEKRRLLTYSADLESIAPKTQMEWFLQHPRWITVDWLEPCHHPLDQLEQLLSLVLVSVIHPSRPYHWGEKDRRNRHPPILLRHHHPSSETVKYYRPRQALEPHKGWLLQHILWPVYLQTAYSEAPLSE